MRLQLGMQSFLVGQLQQTLLEQGYAIDERELGPARYGSDTMRAVIGFQRAHGLVPDGVVGDKTFQALHSPALTAASFVPQGWHYNRSDLAPEVAPGIAAAVQDIGTAEDPPGSNAGPGLKKYAGHVAGEPWCAYWLSWALSHNPGGCPWRVLGSALKIWTWARDHGRVLAESQVVAPGDVWLKMRNSVHGHVGLVIYVSSSSVLSTVEGNSGNAVRGQLRLRDDATAIVRPMWASAHLLG